MTRWALFLHLVHGLLAVLAVVTSCCWATCGVVVEHVLLLLACMIYKVVINVFNL